MCGLFGDIFFFLLNDSKKAEIKTTLATTIQTQINLGSGLTGTKPTKEMSVDNAIDYVTSVTFMQETKTGSDSDFETKFSKVKDSFTRRAALQKKTIQRKAIQTRIETTKAAIKAAKARIETIKTNKAAALVKLVALRARNTWVATANTDDDASSTELATANTKAATLVTKKAAAVTKKKTRDDRKARVQGIRSRLVVIRQRLAANRARR